ncbi:MAG TPA: UDP-2,3-diacylglucosamine diphosphatase [Pseudomonadales bacterium]|nr:UDP-2,3-diacylglucosamine diphosphatase [Pseudomonadales bacterium]
MNETPTYSFHEPDKTHYRTIFLSDIHLGTRGCRADLLLEFLKEHTCDQLYLVGDIIDGWRFKKGFYWPQEHTNVMRRFLTLSKRGTQVTYVTGNHDEFLRKYADMEVGNIRIVDEAVHHTHDGRRFLVVHGDAYDVVTLYHSWVAKLGGLGYDMLVELNTHLNRWRARLGYGFWSLSAWVKYRVKRAVSYVSGFEQAVSHHCRQRGYEGVVCGHIHHAEITDYGDIRYMNCGDWVESCTALVEDESGRFHLIHWADEMAAQANAATPLAAPQRLRA